MEFNDVFIGGLVGASLLGLWNDSKIDGNGSKNKLPLITAVSIRFPPDVEIVKETIQETFFKEKKDFTISYNSKEFELKVAKSRQSWGDYPSLLNLKGCSYDEFVTDGFLTVAIRDSTGIPISKNIALLRNFIKKLEEKLIKYEIW